MSSLTDKNRDKSDLGWPEDVVSLLLTPPQLWLLQASIKHEMEGEEDWHNPPTSKGLEERYTRALLEIYTYEGDDPPARVPVEVTYDDCVAINFHISPDETDEDGNKIGLDLLMRSYEARRALKSGHGDILNDLRNFPDASSSNDFSYEHATKKDVPWREDGE